VNLAIDTDALIKLTKSSSKRAVGTAFTVFVPSEVQKECVEQGKAGGFPDALRVEENIGRGVLRVRKPKRSAKTDAIVKDLRLSGGARITTSSRPFSQALSGPAGDITITASEAISISGQNTGLFSNTQGSGLGGDITLRAPDIRLSDASTVSATSSKGGNAGSITLAGGSFRMSNASLTTEATRKPDARLPHRSRHTRAAPRTDDRPLRMD
jgi:hypothetical protein